jgi:hypothetical protein
MGKHSGLFPKRIWDESKIVQFENGESVYSPVGYRPYVGATDLVINNTSFLLNIETLGVDNNAKSLGTFFIKMGKVPSITQVVGNSGINTLKEIYIVKSGDYYILKLKTAQGGKCVLSVSNLNNSALVSIFEDHGKVSSGGDVSVSFNPNLTDGVHSGGEIFENGERVFSKHYLPPIADEVMIKERTSKDTFVTPFGLKTIMSEVGQFISSLQDKLNAAKKALADHKSSDDHDERYYTKGEINGKTDALSSALNAHKNSGDHDGRYYIKSKVDGFLNTINKKLNTVVKPSSELSKHRTNMLTSIKTYTLPSMNEDEILYFVVDASLNVTDDTPIIINAPSGKSITFEEETAATFNIRKQGKGTLWSVCYVSHMGYIIY